MIASSCPLVSDGSQSGAQFPSRAAEAVWPQWQGQQHTQSNAEHHPHAQGNQQDMFPVSDESPRVSLSCCVSPGIMFSLFPTEFRTCCRCSTSPPTSAATTLRSTRPTQSDWSEPRLPLCLLLSLYTSGALLLPSSCSRVSQSSLSLSGYNLRVKDGGRYFYCTCTGEDNQEFTYD